MPADEIAYLLGYVETSACQFQRNGKTYPAAEARAHLARKYSTVKSRIETAEDFIRYVASASSTTGEAYRAHCPGAKERDSGPWLSDELRRLRERR